MRTHSRVAAAVLALSLAVSLPAQDTPPQPSPPDFRGVKAVPELLAAIRAAERGLEQGHMLIETTGRLPNGSKFRTEGTLRVLRGTHFHVQMKWSFGEDQEGETETVRTPEGLWMRENDPVQGQVFTHMDKDLAQRVEAASAVLGEGSLAGPGAAQAESPLGSRMIEDRAGNFGLTVQGPRTIDGVSVLVVGVPRKASSPDDQLAPEADHVDVLVRVADGAVIRMTQLQKGEPLSEVRVPELDLKVELDPASFVLKAPAGVAFTEVMAHPPARAQIERLSAEAAQKGWKDPAAPATELTGTENKDPDKKDGEKKDGAAR